MIPGISHLTFAVADLDRSLQFYSEWLGFRPLVRWDEGAYLMAGEVWISLILDPAAPEATNNSSYTHTAFAVDPVQFATLKEWFLSRDIEEWQPNASPGESFYFLDPDGHKLEIHARTISDRLDAIRKKPLPGQVWLDES